MKKIIIGILLMFCFAQTHAQTAEADAIVGKWITENNKGVVEIYKWSSMYYGRIISVKEPNGKDGKPLVDKKNPDPKLRTRPIVKLEILKNFVYDGDKVWVDGKVYDPESGNSYSCKITLTDNNTIEVRGFMGVSIVGRTSVWKRKIN